MTQIDVSQLIQAQEITTGTAFIFMFILGFILYAGMKLRSMAVISSWFFLLGSLVFGIILDITMIYFWLITMLNAFVIVMAMGVKMNYG